MPKNNKLNKMKETKKIDATSITSYEDALKFLKRSDDTSKLDTCHNAKALIIIEKLMVIAEAWNKLDNFVPDYCNIIQDKWFPWFKKNNTDRFMFAHAIMRSPYASTGIGSHFCFKTSKRAEEFGRQFIDLWNDFLML